MADDSIFDANGALTRDYLISRGYCCENGCRNCPYGYHERHPVDDRKHKGATTPLDIPVDGGHNRPPKN